MKSKFSKVIYVLCSITILFSLFFIGRENYLEYKEKRLIKTLQEKQKEETHIKDQIQKQIESIEKEDEEKEEIIQEKEEEIQILPQYKSLYEENEDFYGWITISDKVNLPVM